MKPIRLIIFAIPLLVLELGIKNANALPPRDDIPEEILRTEIITNGRSPLDNKPLNASQYEELLAQLAEGKYPPQLSSEVRETVFLLELLKFLRTVTPF